MRRSIVVLIAGVALLSGCASASLPQALDLSGINGGVLLVVHVANVYKPAFQPTNLELVLAPEQVTARPAGFGEDVLAPYRHKVPRVQHEPERHSQFALLIPLNPGTYTLQEIRGSAAKFPIVGGFTLPVR